MSGERTCIVTGSASGIGAAVAAAYRESGHRVVGIDRVDAEVIADLGSAAGRSAAVGAVLDVASTVDVVVACAGMSRPEPSTVAVNYFGTVDVVDGLLPGLRRSNAPRVVVLGSVAAVHRGLGSIVDACLDADEKRAVAEAERAIEAGKGAGIYTSSKQALSRWVRATAPKAEWAGAGVALNAVGPGVVLTPMIAAEWQTDEGRTQLLRGVPMPWGGEPIATHQIVRSIEFLAHPDNRSVTGQVIYVDAGADAVLRGDTVW